SPGRTETRRGTDRRVSVGGATLAARATNEHVVRGEGVATAAGYALERGLEGGVLERLDPPAVVADEVMVVEALPVRGLEARDPVAEVDALHEPELVQALEGAVDARHPDSCSTGAKGVVNLLCRGAAVLSAEVFDDGATCSTAPSARRSEAAERPVSPGCTHER